MPLRRALAASIAVLGVLAAAPAGAAPPDYRLDGGKARTRQYSGSLTSPHVAFRGDPGDPLTPYAEGCTEYSCDLRTLQLVLPKGTSYGRFKVTVELPLELNAALVIYDAKMAPVWTDELWRERGRKDTSDLELTGGYYRLEIQRMMLPAGTYTVGIIDRAGLGSFTADVEWSAHPPDRRV